jgi:hypothetical protein
MAILAFSKTLPMFILVAVIWGIGNAFLVPTLVAYTIDLAGLSRGPAMGTFTALADFGTSWSVIGDRFTNDELSDHVSQLILYRFTKPLSFLQKEQDQHSYLLVRGMNFEILESSESSFSDPRWYPGRRKWRHEIKNRRSQEITGRVWTKTGRSLMRGEFVKVKGCWNIKRLVFKLPYVCA